MGNLPQCASAALRCTSRKAHRGIVVAASRCLDAFTALGKPEFGPARPRPQKDPP